MRAPALFRRLARAPEAPAAPPAPRRAPPVIRRPQDAATAAQVRAAQPEASVWVSANAGSGKTRVLTNRVARLLLSGAAPPRILCLTYTKAAAAEMQNRLFKTLGDWAMAEDARLSEALHGLLAADEPDLTMADQAAARRLFARALETPGGLKIQTIHAFCESVLRRFPLEAGVSPHFEVLDERGAEALMAEARDAAVLARAEDPALADAFERVLGALSEDGLDAALASARGLADAYAAEADPAADPGPALRRLLGAPDAPAAALRAAWAARVDAARLRSLAAAFAADGGKTEAKAAPKLLEAAERLAAGRAAAAPAVAEAEAAAAEQALRGALLTKDGRPPSALPTKALAAAAPWAPAAVDALQDGLARLAEARSAAHLAEDSAAFARVARRVLATYERLKRERGRLDYDDLIGRAVALLTRAEARDWVRFKLDGGVEHILVDEAQDTSPEQWRAVEALAEEFFSGEGAREARAGGAPGEDAPRTVFAVGDEKQSIYSFQGAEPRLLGEKGRAFAGRAEATGRVFRRAALETSFRSAPTILSFVDAVFAPDHARAGLAFGDGAVRHVAARRDAPGRVEIWPLVIARPKEEPPAWDAPVDAPPADDPTRRLAALVAETIHGWIGREPVGPEGRPMRAGDVLVLVRKRGALSNGIIKRLKQLGAPVAGADRLVLTSELVARDLLALGAFLVNPEDDLSLATLLRGPFCAVGEEELFALAAGREGARRLWYALQERRGEAASYAHAYDLLSRLVARADFLRPFELYAQALGPMGGRARLVARLGPEAEDPIDEFLAQTLAFEKSGAPSLQSFLRWMEARAEQLKREHEQDRDEVRVMTAHGAKGLEAPVVVLPDTTAAPQAPALLAPTLFRAPEGFDAAPIWAPRKAETEPEALTAARAEAALAEAEEHRRLLYVALTRAEDRLLICGAAREKARDGSWYALCAAAAQAPEAGARGLETPVAGPDGAPLAGWVFGQDPGPASAAAPPAAAAAPEAAAPPDWLLRAAPQETAPSDVAPSHLGGADPEAEGRQYGGPGGSGLPAPLAKRRGVLIHLLLETLAAARPAARQVRGEQLLARAAEGFSVTQRAEMLAEARRVLEVPALAPLFGPGSRAEVPVSAVLPEFGPGETNGYIDRLAVSDREVLIVDFKTGAAPDRAPEAYVRQLAAYRAALQRAFSGREISAALLWTAEARLERIEPDALDAAFEAAAAALERRRRNA